MTKLTIKRRKELYSKLWKSGGPNHCFFCDVIIVRKYRSLDHLTPHSRGGGTEDENIVLCCRQCNTAKADMTLVEFNIFVRRNGGIKQVKRKFGGAPEPMQIKAARAKKI